MIFPGTCTAFLHGSWLMPNKSSSGAEGLPKLIAACLTGIFVEN
jgi:hypothetical protein